MALNLPPDLAHRLHDFTVSKKKLSDLYEKTGSDMDACGPDDWTKNQKVVVMDILKTLHDLGEYVVAIQNLLESVVTLNKG